MKNLQLMMKSIKSRSALGFSGVRGGSRGRMIFRRQVTEKLFSLDLKIAIVIARITSQELLKSWDER